VPSATLQARHRDTTTQPKPDLYRPESR